MYSWTSGYGHVGWGKSVQGDVVLPDHVDQVLRGDLLEPETAPEVVPGVLRRLLLKGDLLLRAGLAPLVVERLEDEGHPADPLSTETTLRFGQRSKIPL